ncbi:Protein of unknown function [Micromonospora echinaurantiaca]|uniref:DUF2567 domain-containing protein n=1 Tax=Micromonospora echinaurantiaca TaxID=47857 RepID=A0A1C5H7Q1_9ACTN|nr:Protein of unknown function [Micromonospora echinaurantiaca]
MSPDTPDRDRPGTRPDEAGPTTPTDAAVPPPAAAAPAWPATDRPAVPADADRPRYVDGAGPGGSRRPEPADGDRPRYVDGVDPDGSRWPEPAGADRPRYVDSGEAAAWQVERGAAAEVWPAGRRPDEPELPRRRALRLGALAACALALLGVPLGLLWAALAPDTPVIKAPDGAVYAQPQPEQPIAADGWFSLLGLGFGVLAAIALWLVLRRVRGPVGLFAATLGAFGAALVAWQVGRRIGLATFERLLQTAPDGRAFSKPADLRAGGVDLVLGVLPVPHGNLLLPAFGAAVTYTLLAGWSRWPSLRPEPELGAAGLSSVSVATPAPPAAPEPPAPGAAEPPRD